MNEGIVTMIKQISAAGTWKVNFGTDAMTRYDSETSINPLNLNTLKVVVIDPEASQKESFHPQS